MQNEWDIYWNIEFHEEKYKNNRTEQHIFLTWRARGEGGHIF